MKRKFILASAIILTAVVFTNCYPGGGASGGNINAPDYRIVGTWQVTHTTLNGVEIDSTNFHANRPSTFYYFYADHPLQLMYFHNGEIRYSTTGFWYFSNKNKNLDLKFTFLGHKYEYSAKIYKFTKHELIYEYTDEYGNRWKIQLNSRNTLY